MGLPVVQVGKIDLSIVVHVHGDLYLHGRRGLDKAHWGILRMSVHQPYTNGNVVGVI